MAEYKGKLLVCSRCESTLFLKEIDTYTLDGGYSGPYSRYEEMDKDWMKIHELGGHLCPKCSLKFKRIIAEFMGYHQIINVAPVWRVEVEEASNA